MAKKKAEKVEETIEEVEVEKVEEAVEEKTVPLYELSREGTQFYDNGFILRSGEQKELPDNPSNRLLERIESGFIKEVN